MKISFLVCTIIIVISASLLTAQDYTVRNLGTFGKDAIPNAINSNGDVVGYSYLDSRYFHAFLWTKSGGLQDLGTLGTDIVGADDISDNGDIAGSAQTQIGMAAFRWTKDGGMQELGTLNGGYTFATGIDQAGNIVGGSALNGTGGFQAVLWSGGNILDLGNLGDSIDDSWATAINDKGEITGMSDLGNSTSHAFLWTQNDGMKDLGTLGGAYSRAGGINNATEIVGFANLPSGPRRAFLWTRTTGMKDLGTLGGTSSSATKINNRGQVVGEATLPDETSSAFLWSKTGGMLDLRKHVPAKWVLLTGQDINDAGQIVATAHLGIGKRRQAVLLTPVMATTLTSSKNPSQMGEAVTLRVTVGNAIQGPPPDGEIVTLKDGWKILVQVPLHGGVAEFTTSQLIVHSHSIRAFYSGDTTYNSSKSAIVLQVVQQ